MLSEDAVVKIVAIVCLTLIAIVSLINRVDSMIVGSVCAVIGGVAGYTIGRVRDKVLKKYRD